MLSQLGRKNSRNARTKSGVDLEIVVDQFVSIATRMLSEDVDDEYIRLCYNWEE